VFPKRKPASSRSSPDRPREADHIRLGRLGELEAARFLRRRGHRILARHFTGADGEIDLIASYGALILFVEVKTRTDDAAADPADAAREPQWERIARSARTFLSHPAAEGRPWRFDLVTVLWAGDGRPRIEQLQDIHRPRWW
jgi:putative endonuclease